MWVQYWVGIAGGPGSGKSTLSAAVSQRLSTMHGINNVVRHTMILHYTTHVLRPSGGSSLVCVCVMCGLVSKVVPMDGFHLRKAQLDGLPDPENAHRLRGAPFTFDAHGLVRALSVCRRASCGSFPGFDHGVGDPVEDSIRVAKEHSVVLCEGNYLLLPEPEPWGEIKPLFDESWYIRVRDGVNGHGESMSGIDRQCERVIRRHMASWGVSWSDAEARVMRNDRPNILLVEEHARLADHVIDSV